MFKNAIFSVLGLLLGGYASHLYHKTQVADASLSGPLLLITSFEGSNYYDFVNETDEAAYCFRYKTTKGVVDMIHSGLSKENNYSEQAREKARKAVSDFRSSWPSELKYSCDDI